MPSGWSDHQLAESARLLDWLRASERADGAIARLSDRLADCFAHGGRVLTCGNGGSMCDAMHLAEDLSGRYRLDRPALSAQAISDPAHLTCVANDYGYDRVFARGVDAWGRAGDVLVVFSTSGRSPNIVAAAHAARARGMRVIGLLGRDGGEVAPICDDAVVVPTQDSARAQEIHLQIIHLLVEGVERRLVPGNYSA
jgi:D-sedoheptulose 7-phosphate isomerase